MYNTYPYRTCYDQVIDSTVVKVITTALSLSSEKYGKLPKTPQKTTVKGKEIRVLMPATNLQDIIQHHAQKVADTGSTPYSVVVADITTQVNIALTNLHELV